MDELLTKHQTQALWGVAFSLNIERSRPWTKEEVHGYLMKHKGINSMKLVKAADVEELRGIFSGEPIATESSKISDDEIPF